MNFFQRFKRFMVGVLLGSILVFFFFSDRSELITAWMPNERVMKRLRETTLLIPDSVRCRLNCHQLDSTKVSGLLTDGDVSFANSFTRQEPKLYKVDFEQHEIPVRLTFACTDSTSAVVEVLSLEGLRPCDCP